MRNIAQGARDNFNWLGVSVLLTFGVLARQFPAQLAVIEAVARFMRRLDVGHGRCIQLDRMPLVLTTKRPYRHGD